MSFIELFLIAVSLAMDAFAVSVSNGLILPNVKKRDAVTFGLYFGLFQFFMPVIGYFLGSKLTKYVQQFDHWIAFILLGIIGFNMIKESFSDDEDDIPKEKEILKVKNMTMLAIATSIDALAVGVTFAFIGNISIFFACYRHCSFCTFICRFDDRQEDWTIFQNIRRENRWSSSHWNGYKNISTTYIFRWLIHKTAFLSRFFVYYFIKV